MDQSMVGSFFSHMPMVICTSSSTVVQANPSASAKLKRIAEGEKMFDYMDPYDILRFEAAFTEGEERIVLAVAKRVAKELNKVGYVSVRSIVKITAEKLNQIDLSEQAGKIAGGCMLVTDAAELTKESVEKLKSVMEQEDEKVVVMLAGPFDEMDCFLDIYPDLAEKLVYKVRM